jgi:hypothetical protein
MAFKEGFKKVAQGSIGQMIGFPGATPNVGKATPKPPPPPKNVSAGGKTLGQMIGFPGS